jgi:hypothetical protein
MLAIKKLIKLHTGRWECYNQTDLEEVALRIVDWYHLAHDKNK